MLEILLVFSMNSAPATVSDRIFQSFGECAMFVNELVQDDVVNSDYGFSFFTSDGKEVVGQCIEKIDWERLTGETVK